MHTIRRAERNLPFACYMKGDGLMKFLHISDLHIGKRLNDVSLIDDQRFVLEQICGIAEKTACNAVLVAGDVYDKSNPSADAMTLFDNFLAGLAEKKIPVYVISGNHDSRQRVSYLSGLVKQSGIFISESFVGKAEKYVCEDEYGVLNVYLLPFIRPIDVKKYYPDDKIESYDDAVRIVIKNTEIDPSERNVIVCHQFVTGASVCDSEEFAVGGLDNISSDIFNDFDYVAMGHIHGPQHISRPQVRYSGSPLKYSFSEAKHVKSATIVDIKEKGDVEITTEPLGFLHDVREVKGGMKELMELPFSEDYVRVVVTDESVAPDARVSLLTVFPNMMRFAVENSHTMAEYSIEEAEGIENKTPTELFCDFYRLMHNNEEPTAEHIALIEEMIERLGD